MKIHLDVAVQTGQMESGESVVFSNIHQLPASKKDTLSSTVNIQS